MARDSTDDGVLLIGHGTRDPAGDAALLELAGLVREGIPGGMVAPCFLDFAEPTIGQGVALLARAGVQQILAVPLMLLVAGHVRRDIPKALAAAGSDYPRVEIHLTAHLGCSQPLLESSAERFREAVCGSPETTEETALVLVGRGNRDVEAQAEMRRFAELRRELTPVARLQTCFLAMARPSLPVALALAAELAEKRIVVQPHLLFPGRLAATIRQAVGAARRNSPEKRWLLAQPLGPDRLLAGAVRRLVAAAASGRGARRDREPGGEASPPAGRALAGDPPAEDTPCSESLFRVRSLVSRYRLRS
jgi:sirohydrochlorin ferrochelatase